MELEEQRLIDHILSDAREDANSILEKASNSADAVIKREKERAIENAEKEINTLLKRGEDEVEDIRRIIIADAKLKASWIVPSEMKRLVTSVLDEVKTQLETFSQSEMYVSLLQRLIVESGIILGGDKLEVLLREKDSKLPLKLSNLTKTIEEKTGKETELKISNERIESIGGCVIRTCNGRIMMDNTFPVILKRREKKLRSEILKILFG